MKLNTCHSYLPRRRFYRISKGKSNYGPAHVWFNICRVLESQNNVDKAIEKYEKAIMEFPSYWSAQRHLDKLSKIKDSVRENERH